MPWARSKTITNNNRVQRDFQIALGEDAARKVRAARNYEAMLICVYLSLGYLGGIQHLFFLTARLSTISMNPLMAPWLAQVTGIILTSRTQH